MEYPKHPGIYAIVHDESGKVYIGSAKNIYSRWRFHKSLLRRSLHHSPHLQNSWNKYGESAFRFVVLEACLKDAVMLSSREQHWLDKYRGKLFNAARYADTNYGKRQSEEQKKANSLFMMGNKHGQGHGYHGVLTERAVVEILHRFAAGGNTADLALEYGVTQNTVARIVRRRIWKGVQVHPDVDAACRARSKGRVISRSKLDFAKAEEIRNRHREGESLTSLVISYEVTELCIRHVIDGKTWNAPVVVAIELPPEPVAPPVPKPPRQKKRSCYVTKPRSERIVIPCGTCGKERLLPPCKANMKRYCSRECLLAGMSVRQKRLMQDPAARAKIAAKLAGTKLSEETRAKMSASLKRWNQSQRDSGLTLF